MIFRPRRFLLCPRINYAIRSLSLSSNFCFNIFFTSSKNSSDVKLSSQPFGGVRFSISCISGEIFHHVALNRNVHNDFFRFYLFQILPLSSFKKLRSEEHTSELQSRGHL